MSDTLDFLKVVPGLLACGGVYWQWRLRHDDAEKLRRMEGNIRKTIEEDLKIHEVRLRVGADLKLKLHERSWLALREFIQYAFEAQQHVRSFGLAAVSNKAGIAGENPDLARERAEVALSRFQASAATAPPDTGAMALIRPYIDAYNLAVDVALALNGTTVAQLLASSQTMATAFGQIGKVAERWNASLWSGAAELPLLVQETANAQLEKSAEDAIAKLTGQQKNQK